MRLLLALLAMLLTTGAGIPSTPVDMASHCAEHGPGHQQQHPTPHEHSTDTHCPAHGCASAAPCSTLTALLATAGAATAAPEALRLALPAVVTRFNSRDAGPGHPPPKVPSA